MTILSFTEMALPGAYVITPRRFDDARGFFAVAWNREDFESLGLCADFVQGNLSYNHQAGTLRGLHSRRAPHQEVKLVRCVRGAIWDVLVDIRPGSATFGQSAGVELSAENRAMVYVPKDFLHGYLTLTDDTEVEYQVTRYYEPQAEFSVRYDDPALAIGWPAPVAAISDKDAQAPTLAEALNLA